MKTKKQKTRVIKGNIHNPKVPVGLSSERKAMPSKNKKKKGKGGRRNTAAKNTAAKPKTVIRYKTKPAAATQNKKKKRRKNSARRSLRNGFTFKGLNAVDLGVGAISLISTQALAQAIKQWVDPGSLLGIGIQIGMAAGIFAIAPASIRNAATLGAGITPVANGINRLTGNVIGSTIENTVRGFLPAQVQTPANGNGMSGFVNPRPGQVLYRTSY
jgi:hypothetical protein